MSVTKKAIMMVFLIKIPKKPPPDHRERRGIII